MVRHLHHQTIIAEYCRETYLVLRHGDGVQLHQLREQQKQ